MPPKTFSYLCVPAKVPVLMTHSLTSLVPHSGKARAPEVQLRPCNHCRPLKVCECDLVTGTQ